MNKPTVTLFTSDKKCIGVPFQLRDSYPCCAFLPGHGVVDVAWWPSSRDVNEAHMGEVILSGERVEERMAELTPQEIESMGDAADTMLSELSSWLLGGTTGTQSPELTAVADLAAHDAARPALLERLPPMARPPARASESSAAELALERLAECYAESLHLASRAHAEQLEREHRDAQTYDVHPHDFGAPDDHPHA